ncbi:MAG TPA: aminotransferase class I/II-fold pyridoxal phosphate-dependent enzyme [Actinomycetota bacterium]|nr:aminotransferase class I/II-fold pyridoxal phosphate-dependent enzyme [Actinomycetota bacterium]
MTRYPLEPSVEEMRAMGEAALRFVERFIEELPDAAAVDVAGAVEAAARVEEPMPEGPGRLEDLLDIVRLGADKAFNTTGPGYLAYIPGGGLYAAALGEFLAMAINRYVGVWAAAPVLVNLEWQTVRWLADLFAYPSQARGILTTGGSLSNLSAVVTARHALLGENFREATVYVTDQTHASVTKSVTLAGLPPRSLRLVRRDDQLRMDPDALRAMVKEDRERGLRPFLVVPSAGTTNTGAIDPLADVVSVAREEELWVHVDGAYGGPFQMTERGRSRFRGIEEAESIALDPHKAMFLPYGTGALLVRDGARLREAHTVGADYLQDLGTEQEIPNFTDYSPELSRSFRGLGLWLPLKLHGVAAFREGLDEKLDLTAVLYEGLRDIPELEVPWEPQLTVVAFRSRSGDDATRRLLERINASKRVFLSSTMIDGRFVIRACIVSHRTHRDRIEEAIEIVRAAARAVDS